MHFSHRFVATFFLSTAAIATPLGSAIAQHSDVLLANIGGQATVGAAADIGGAQESFDLDTRVFESVLLAGGLLPPALAKDFEGNEPGFFGLDAVANAADLAALSAAPLPAGADVGISLTPFSLGGATGTLLYWDGTGPVSFEPAPAETSFSFEPAGAFALTGGGGGFDDHPVYQLDNGGAGKPADGVYAVAPTISVAGLDSSEPFYLVFLADALIIGDDDAEAVEAALERVEEGLSNDAMYAGKDFAFYERAVDFVDATVVPEPHGLALLSLAAITAGAL
ncbi:MAG: hypothetical protein KDA44_23560, partial [Planctomycetales bacterium]|nr:hypothetical protein [Planctomycetales bacterium]